MTTYSTGNPLGSTDPRDLYDNAENLDNLVNGDQAAYNDRLGKSRKSWQGIEDEFAAFIAASGYQFAGDYAAGIEITQYNQVVRDTSGEFWRVSGSTELPYTTTGAGLPEGGALVPVGDAAIRQQLSSHNGYRLVAGQMAANAYGVPAPLSDVTVQAETHRIIDYFNGLLYSTAGGDLYASSDMGVTYSLVRSGKSPIGILPTADGEVVMLFSNRIEKSSGWSANPATATFTAVLSLPVQTNPTYFLRWGFDGDGQKFIATHYGDNVGGIVSRVWISTDAGSTFSVVYDQSVDTPGVITTHFHAACYDPWADRFYFNYGHGEPAGIYYSDDDGLNWTKMSQYSFEDEGVTATFTTMVATDFGIVCGTDRYPNGVYILRRSQNPDDLKLEMAKRWDSVRGGLLGFADRAFRDPDTGIVYTSFQSNWPEVAPVIIACGSGGANIVYTGELNPDNARRIFNVIAAKGKLIAYITDPNQTIRANLSRYTSSDNALVRGNLEVPFDAPFSSTIAGYNSQTDGDRVFLFGAETSGFSRPAAALFDATAVGHSAKLAGSESVAIGSQSMATIRSVAIGHGVKTGPSVESAPTSVVAIGYGAVAQENFATSIGSLAEAVVGNVSVGYSAKSSQPSATAVGRAATASGINATAVGQGALAGTSFAPTAIGQGSKAASSYTVAVGYIAECVGGLSTAIGARAKCDSSNSVAVGDQSNVTGSGGTAVGALSTCNNGLALGYQTSATGFESVAVGRGAQASSSSSVAIGHGAKATGTNSVAIGSQTETVRANSVCVGDRDIESTKPGGGIFLKSPNGTLYKITVSDAGVLSASAV